MWRLLKNAKYHLIKLFIQSEWGAIKVGSFISQVPPDVVFFTITPASDDCIDIEYSIPGDPGSFIFIYHRLKYIYVDLSIVISGGNLLKNQLPSDYD